MVHVIPDLGHGGQPHVALRDVCLAALALSPASLGILSPVGQVIWIVTHLWSFGVTKMSSYSNHSNTRTQEAHKFLVVARNGELSLVLEQLPQQADSGCVF